MHNALRFEQSSRSDVGCVRAVNEDAYLSHWQGDIWAVADGMGGHARGRWASAQIVAALEVMEFPADLEGASDATIAAIHEANQTILLAGQAEDKVIGSTVTALIIRDQRFTVVWAGDSRVYRIRRNSLSRLTSDHTPVEEMVKAGLLTRQEAGDHPMAHMLSRAVGVRQDLMLDQCSGEVLPGDVFILCSDGLTRVVPDHELLTMVGQCAPNMAASALVECALTHGAADNVTVVVVGCDETTHVAA
ncbi:PP2C family protein-serine/threonine phosphatase [Sphingomonas arantia]|uniref:PP2C family protein-serine/threonine phosphatase n=1 Tax=Sphingomonas arantia TaxID=1460676 RepID=A0ABW4TXQ4_9SPHN